MKEKKFLVFEKNTRMSDFVNIYVPVSELCFLYALNLILLSL